MGPLLVAVDDRLANAGDTYAVQGHLDEAGYTLGDRELELPRGVDYDLVLTNTGEGILTTGLVRAQVRGACDRCLETAEFDIAAEVDEYYLFEEPEDMGEDEDEADFSLVSPDRTVDLGVALLTALVMETPFVVLCRDDCKGLCPTCGANLNEEDCGHAAEREAARAAESPFAALKNLDLSE